MDAQLATTQQQILELVPQLPPAMPPPSASPLAGPVRIRLFAACCASFVLLRSDIGRRVLRLASQICWRWRDDSNVWHPYPPEVSARLEAALAANKRSVDVDSERFVDVKKMVQGRWDDPRRTRSVQRGSASSSPGGFSPPPAFNPAASPNALEAAQARQAQRAKLLESISEKEATIMLLKREGQRTQLVEQEIEQLRVNLAALA